MEFKVVESKVGLALVASEGCEFVGEGHFCGWYEKESLRNARVLARIRLADEKEVAEIDQMYHDLPIRTIMTEQKFEAESIDKAREKFKQIVSEKQREQAELAKKEEQEKADRLIEFNKLWNYIASTDEAHRGEDIPLPRLHYLLKKYYCG